VTPVPAEPRRRREVAPPTDPVPQVSVSVDLEAAWEAIQRAAEQLDQADAAAEETNRRVAAALRSQSELGS
jgi:ABC-type transporter Mla subunit MlaD